MNMNDILNKRKRNEKKDIIKFAENSEKKKEGSLDKLLEKGKKMINQYMDNKFQRFNAILLKEEKIKKKRLREDIEIEKEKEIAKFEEEIYLKELREKLRFNIDNFEGFVKEENIISLNEEEKEENLDLKQKMKYKNQK